MASLKRANRTFGSGHWTPSGASFIDSPEPMPSTTRLGYRQPRVANACATTGGGGGDGGGNPAVPNAPRRGAPPDGAEPRQCRRRVAAVVPPRLEVITH